MDVAETSKASESSGGARFDTMIVCSCNVLSDGQVRECLNAGPDCPRTAAQVYQCLGCSPKCGRCARTIRAIMAGALVAADTHACSTNCAATCPLAHAAEHAHSDHTHADQVHAESLADAAAA